MLTRIILSNFKSFIYQDLKLSKMTLLAGLNNSGKSSFIQAIRMLRKHSRNQKDPCLPGHGSLKEIRNINASSSGENVVIECYKEKSQIEMTIDFLDANNPWVYGSSRNHLTTKPTLGIPLISYVGADRWGPQVTLPMHSDRTYRINNVGEQGEYVIDFLRRHERDIVSEKLIHPESEGKTLEYNVRAWLEEISPNVVFKHGADPQRDISYAVINGFRPTNAGFGLSYTLPVIVSLLGMAADWKDEAKPEGSPLVMLENPEAHLHPQGQTTMGKLIARAAASGVQVIVETHSDHLMDGVRIAVKEGILPAEDTTFHYFSLDEDGMTRVETPILHPNGKLDYWPEGFFDQTMKNRAILARR